MKKTIFLLSLIFSVAYSCFLISDKQIFGNGVVTTQLRTIASDDYRKIRTYGTFDVTLVADAQNSVIITGEENLIPYIIIAIDTGILIIKTKDNVSLYPKKPLKIKVSFKNINEVSIFGSGDVVIRDVVRSDDISLNIKGSGNIAATMDADNVSVSISGSGDVTIAGTTNNLDVNVQGSGDIKAYALKSEVVVVSIKGSSNLETTVRDTLKGAIMGSGDILYKGSPNVQVRSNGSGEITRKD